MRLLGIPFVFAMLVCCLPPTKEERKLLDELNAKYVGYKFSAFGGVEDVYVKLKLQNRRTDSTMLRKVYRDVMAMNLDSYGKPRTNWLYVIVYDRDGDYMFTMRDYDGNVRFFEDKIF